MSRAALGTLLKVGDIRNKILITFGLVFVYRIGYHVPLPGVNRGLLMQYADSIADKGVASIVGLMNALSAGNLNSPTLMSLGILPYISSSIIFSLLSKTIPSLEALTKEGPAGQRKINQYSRYFTVPLCLVQGTVIYSTLFRGMEYEGLKVVDQGFGTLVIGVLAMTAGTLFVMWIGEQITEHGIGNGVSLLITAGIVGDVPRAFYRMFSEAQSDRSYVITAVVLLAVYLLVVVCVVFMTKGARRIPIQQAKQMRGRKMMGGARHFLPLKLNMANVMPVIFASSLLVLPQTIGSWIGGPGSNFLSYGGWWWITLEVGLIFFFSYFWTSLMFQPAEMANNLREYGSFVPGIPPGKKTAKFLERVMVRITLVGAAFLAVIAVFPTLVSKAMGVDPFVASFLGGTGILIVVGVTLDLVDKLNNNLLMRNYEGFMSGAGSKKGSRGA